jgi:hypothetical protein
MGSVKRRKSARKVLRTRWKEMRIKSHRLIVFPHLEKMETWNDWLRLRSLIQE